MDKIDVRKVRRSLDYTQDEFAKTMNVSPRTVWAWEHGATLPQDKEAQMLSLLKQYREDMKTAPVRSVRNEEEDDGIRIPLLPISAIGGGMNDDDLGVMPYETESVLSPVRNAQMAVRVSGDSMYPRYPNGSMVFVREVDASIFIEWGGYYVVNTTNGTIIKRVFKGEDNTIECRSVNPDYQPFNVPMGEVRKMYKILGSLHLE